MVRPRDQARRREEVLDAAALAVFERGAGEVRLRDVADRVGVTPASILYYYGDLAGVLAALFERSTLYYARQRREEVDAVAGWWPKLVACIRSGVPSPGAGEMYARVLMELFPTSFRNPDVAQLQRAFLDEQIDLYSGVLREGAQAREFLLTETPEFHAREFIALEDGYTIDVLCRTMSAADAERAILRRAEALLGPAEAGRLGDDRP
ncbi:MULTISPECIES: TetR/AcrR family transcriptional regulator [unclassified Microbacterium]|uniref:TetR/AcrR family transcriptional regulator n=1 Tax=unclassified Microbacterium TaxID=2609290 RepID=UPI003018C602